MNWEGYREDNEEISLLKAFHDEHRDEPLPNMEFAEKFLSLVRAYQPIRSRQAAAIALAIADIFGMKVDK